VALFVDSLLRRRAWRGGVAAARARVDALAELVRAGGDRVVDEGGGFLGVVGEGVGGGSGRRRGGEAGGLRERGGGGDGGGGGVPGGGGGGVCTGDRGGGGRGRARGRGCPLGEPPQPIAIIADPSNGPSGSFRAFAGFIGSGLARRGRGGQTGGGFFSSRSAGGIKAPSSGLGSRHSEAGERAFDLVVGHHPGAAALLGEAREGEQLQGAVGDELEVAAGGDPGVEDRRTR